MPSGIRRFLPLLQIGLLERDDGSAWSSTKGAASNRSSIRFMAAAAREGSVSLTHGIMANRETAGAFTARILRRGWPQTCDTMPLSIHGPEESVCIVRVDVETFPSEGSFMSSNLEPLADPLREGQARGHLAFCEEVARDGAQARTLLNAEQRIEIARRHIAILGDDAFERLVFAVGFPGIADAECQIIREVVEVVDGPQASWTRQGRRSEAE